MRGKYVIALPAEELMDLGDLADRIVGETLITVSDAWEAVRRDVREGDEVILAGYAPEWPEPVAQLHAIVTALNDEVPGIEVIV